MTCRFTLVVDGVRHSVNNQIVEWHQDTNRHPAWVTRLLSCGTYAPGVVDDNIYLPVTCVVCIACVALVDVWARNGYR